MAVHRYPVVYDLATDGLASGPETARANTSWGAMELYLRATALPLPVAKATAKSPRLRHKENVREVNRPAKKRDASTVPARSKLDPRVHYCWEYDGRLLLLPSDRTQLVIPFPSLTFAVSDYVDLFQVCP